MKDLEFLGEMGLELLRLSKPYQYNEERAKECLRLLENWERKSENDCLRARGDMRWLKAIELDAQFKELLKPF